MDVQRSGPCTDILVYLPMEVPQFLSSPLSRRHHVRSSQLFKAGAALALTTGIVLAPATAFAAGTVTGTVTCYWPNADGTTTFSVGYVNTGATTVTIPVGANNYVSPSPQDRGQPTTFLAGSHPNVWAPSLTATELGQNPNWFINGVPTSYSGTIPQCACQAGLRQRQHHRLPRLRPLQSSASAPTSSTPPVAVAASAPPVPK